MNDKDGAFWVDEETEELVLSNEDEEYRFYIEEELKLEGNKYLILIPSEEDESEDDEALVLKLIDDSDDEVLSVIEDDDEFERVKEAYLSL